MTPPMVQASSLAGSGPSRRRYGASRLLTARTVTPGSTRTRAPSSRTSTPWKWVRVSTSTLSLIAWPESDVPPPRRVSGTPSRVQARMTSATWSAPRGIATAWGWSR